MGAFLLTIVLFFTCIIIRSHCIWPIPPRSLGNGMIIFQICWSKNKEEFIP